MSIDTSDDRIMLDMDDAPRAVAPVETDTIDLSDDVTPATPIATVAPVIASPFCVCDPAPLAARRPGSARTSAKICTKCEKERAPIKANATPATTTSQAPADLASVRNDIATSTTSAPVATVVAPTRTPALVRGDLVAGAAAVGHGVLVGWTGSGNMVREAIVQTIANAQAPIEWAPEARSARAQAGNAISTLRSKGYQVKNETKGERPDLAAYDTMWTVAESAIGESAVIGGSSGRIVTIFRLTAGVLAFEGDAELGSLVVADYQSRIAKELYRAADVTHWLGGVMYDRLGAVRFGGVWYVPRQHATLAARICETFSKVWGTEWLVPALPVATSAQLQDGLVVGLTKEVDDVCAQLDAQRENAKTKGKDDVGQRAAASHLTRIREITERVQAYGALLGEDRVASLRGRLQVAANEVDELLDDGMGTIQRFSLLWEEVERDMRKAARMDAVIS